MSKKKKPVSVNFFADKNTSRRKSIIWIEQNTHQFLIIVFTIIGFFYRLVFAMNAQGILHPDEIFQGLEMGHKIAFGSGVVPPEFKNENLNTPSYAALRSWTFPLIFGGIMLFLDFFGLDYFGVTLPTIRFLLAVNSTLLIISSRKLAWQITKNQNVELFTTVFIAIWYRMIDFTVRSFTNTFFLPLLFYAIYRILVNMEENKISQRDNLVVIIGIGIASYNRLDLIIIILPFFLISINSRKIKIYRKHLVNTLLGWVFGLSIDYYYYGEFVIPPLNWFRFNIIENNSDIFSIEPWNFYIENIIILDGLKPFVLFAIGIHFISFIFMKNKSQFFYPQNKQLISGYNRLFFSTSIIWILYTSFWRNLTLQNFINFSTRLEGWESQSHKEIRFMIGGLVVLLIYVSTGLEVAIIMSIRILQWLLIDLRKAKSSKFIISEIKYWTNLILPILLIVMILLQSISYANNRQYVESHSNVNTALEFVGGKNDTTGVIVGVSWYQSGGYTYSHLTSEISIVFVNFVQDNPDTLELNKRVALTYLRNYEYNYFIVPKYQFQWYPDLLSNLLANGWHIIKIMDGIVEIWQRS